MKNNCDLQVFPLNGAKPIGRNSRKIIILKFYKNEILWNSSIDRNPATGIHATGHNAATSGRQLTSCIAGGLLTEASINLPHEANFEGAAETNGCQWKSHTLTMLFNPVQFAHCVKVTRL